MEITPFCQWNVHSRFRPVARCTSQIAYTPLATRKRHDLRVESPGSRKPRAAMFLRVMTVDVEPLTLIWPFCLPYPCPLHTSLPASMHPHFFCLSPFIFLRPESHVPGLFLAHQAPSWSLNIPCPCYLLPMRKLVCRVWKQNTLGRMCTRSMLVMVSKC